MVLCVVFFVWLVVVVLIFFLNEDIGEFVKEQGFNKPFLSI